MEKVRAIFGLMFLIAISVADISIDISPQSVEHKLSVMPGSVQVLFLANKAGSFDGSSTRVMAGAGEMIFAANITQNLEISANSRFSLIARTERYDVDLSIHLNETFLGNITLTTLDWAEYSFIIPKAVSGNSFVFRSRLTERTNFYFDRLRIRAPQPQVLRDKKSIDPADLQLTSNPLADHSYQDGILSYRLQREGLIRIKAEKEPICLRPDSDLKLLVYSKIIDRGKVLTEIKTVQQYVEYTLKKGQMADILGPDRGQITLYGCN